MNYRNRKRCDTCKKGSEMCIFMEQAKNARTAAQKKAEHTAAANWTRLKIMVVSNS